MYLGTLFNIIEVRYSNSEPYKYAKNFAQKKARIQCACLKMVIKYYNDYKVPKQS